MKKRTAIETARLMNDNLGAEINRWQNADTKYDRELAEIAIYECDAYSVRWHKIAGISRFKVGNYVAFYSNGGGRPYYMKIVKIGNRGGIYGIRYYRTRPPSRPMSIR